MAHTKHWIASFRLRTLPLSLSTIFAGSYGAAVYDSFRWDVLWLASLTTLFLQILSNLSNDYGDAVKGTDKYRQGEARMVQSGLITLKEMQRMIVVFAILSLVSGVGLLWIALPALFSLKGLLYLITGVLGIGAAINYTVGRNPYGYKGWGDFFVFVFFGLVGVYGSYYLHAGVFRWEVLLLASAVGLLSAAVLNVNNMRDEVSDRASRKLSMVVMWGHRFGVIYHVCLVLLAWLALTWFVAINHVSVFNWMFVLTLPLFVIHLQKVLTIVELRLLDPELKRLAIATFLTVLLIIVGWLF